MTGVPDTPQALLRDVAEWLDFTDPLLTEWTIDRQQQVEWPRDRVQSIIDCLGGTEMQVALRELADWFEANR
jgi:hypothetical protein